MSAKCTVIPNYKNDYYNGKKQIVNITKNEYPGYMKTTTITTTYSNSKLPSTQASISTKKIQLSNPKLTISNGNKSILTSIKYEPSLKTYQSSSKIISTKVGNVSYQSPYISKNILADKSMNYNKTTYESPYQNRFTNLSPLSSPEILNSKKYNIISQSSINNFSNTKPSTNHQTLINNNYNGINKYSNKISSNTISPMKISTPNITTYPIKATSSPSSVGYKSNLSALAPLNIANFKAQININDNINKKLGPGKLYIFNHDEFQNPNNEYRDGSKSDVKLLKDTFKKFKVNVTLFENYTVKKVKNQVDKIYKEDLSKSSCIVIAILSHGNRMERIAANDGSYSIHDDILFPILRNKTLEGKPKILIVQACKGDMDLREFKTDSCQVNTKVLIPDEIYKFYSTSEGFVSYRNEKGSIFIKSFCEELEKSGTIKPIRDIMEAAIKNIKMITSGQQIPSMWVNNTEPYVFGKYC